MYIRTRYKIGLLFGLATLKRPTPNELHEPSLGPSVDEDFSPKLDLPTETAYIFSIFVLNYLLLFFPLFVKGWRRPEEPITVASRSSLRFSLSGVKYFSHFFPKRINLYLISLIWRTYYFKQLVYEMKASVTYVVLLSFDYLGFLKKKLTMNIIILQD